MAVIAGLLGAIIVLLIVISITLDKIHDTLKEKSSLTESDVQNAVEEALKAHAESVAFDAEEV